MKIYFYSIFIYILFSVLTLFSGRGNLNSAELVDRIVVVVNDKIIALSELNDLLKPYQNKIDAMGQNSAKEGQVLYTLREKMLNQLINDKLTDEEVARYEMKVTEEEIDNAIERIKSANYHTDEDFREILASEGLTVEEYRNDLKGQILRSRVVDYEVRSKVVITKEDILLYYEANPEKYTGKKRYHLRNILMRPSSFADKETRQELLGKMEDILLQLKKGESFSDLARLYSQSQFAEEGGDIGFFNFDDFSPKINDALKGLKAGESTVVLNTEQGFQIFYIEAIEDAPGKSLEEVSEEIKKKLYTEKVNKRFKVWVEGMRAKSHIKIIQ
ncbi:MAG: SurA N-terminal domain-containing protein [Deltaproteobacteria bacterium]|nr:SurA N-terminal domain-containing protein [Deltaproteobacteria bacterium]